MTLLLEYETDIALGFSYESLIKKVIHAALDYEKCPFEVELNIVFTDNTSIQEVNKEHRDIDEPTDVLSFPMIEYVIPSDFEKVGKMGYCFHPETGELLLGDIMISVEKVISQAEEYGHSTERELGFLVAHSMLHLFGYDHMEEKEREVMEFKQNAILKSIGVNR